MSDQPPDAGPEPLLSSQDDAAVAALLRAAGGPVSMPPEVAARIDAALAVEASMPATTGEVTTGGVATGTVTPLVPRPRRWSRAVLGLAAAAAVVVVGGALVTTLGDGASSTDDQATSAEAGGATDQADVARSTSGRDYTAAELTDSVSALLADSGAAPDQPAQESDATLEQAPSTLASAPAADSGEAGEPARDDADAAAATALVLDEARLTPCLDRLTDGTREVVAVDAGTYEGQPALAVLLAAGADAVDVFIVTPACSADDASILHFERVER
jgi:hypothetical protein